jgi:hypothetical protein
MLMVALGKENVSACYMLDVGIELAMTFTILKAVLGLWSISATAMYVRARRRVIKAERAYREAEYMRRLERRAQAEKLAESNGLWTLDRANRWDRILDLPITIPR